MEKEYKITIKNFFRHLHIVNKHRFKVFILCTKGGISLQGLVHDLSKYFLVEFWKGVKYYQGNYGPIRNCKKINGYSIAWIHHKNHDKQHYEYWYDYESIIESPIIPFKYFLEMISDSLATGQTYQEKIGQKNINYLIGIKLRKKLK